MDDDWNSPKDKAGYHLRTRAILLAGEEGTSLPGGCIQELGQPVRIACIPGQS